VHTLNELILDGREKKALSCLSQGLFTLEDITRQDMHSNTPLHWAAKLGFSSVISALMEHGAHTCAHLKNDKQKTAYDYALANSLAHEVLDLLNPTHSVNDGRILATEKSA
jgi:ankyrin repeat protein